VSADERLRAQVGGHHDDGLNLREHGFGVDLRDVDLNALASAFTG
jgi:hypothetical protein